MPAVLRWILGLGPTNPVAVRIVQNGSRRTHHMYVRAGYLAVLVLVLLWSLLTIGAGNLDYRVLASRAAASFTYVAYLQIALITILTPVFMAGAIAQESGPRTWDVLLSTPLSGGQIVLGNLFGRLFFVLSLLVCSLPLFALTQYFGGVPGSAIFAGYAISGAAATFVGAVAVALATSRIAGRRAVFAFYVSVVSYIAVTAAIDALIQNRSGTSGVTWMTCVNPFLAMRSLLEPTGYPRAGEGVMGLAGFFLGSPVTAFCAISLVVSTALVGVSVGTVRLGGLGGTVRVRRSKKLLGKPGEAGHRAPRGVGRNPIAWREAAARNATLGKIIARWAFIGLGGLFGLVLIVLYHSGSMTADTFRLALLATVWAEVGVTVLVAINMSATAISREREDGTLDLILTTPITPRQYLNGKLLGLVAYLLPMLAVPIGTLLMAGGYVLAGGFGGPGTAITNTSFGTTVTEPLVLPEAGLVAAAVTIPFVAFCVMVGLHWSLRSKGTLGSVVGSVAWVAVVGGTVGLCGWKSAEELTLVGPALAGLNPATTLLSAVSPVEAMLGTTVRIGATGAGAGVAGLEDARVSLALGAVLSIAIYGAVVWGVRSSLERGFDVTTRKLAGTR
ncbi:MAG: ABC transporter permease subunit [Planctomycetota bacterium]